VFEKALAWVWPKKQKPLWKEKNMGLGGQKRDASSNGSLGHTKKHNGTETEASE